MNILNLPDDLLLLIFDELSFEQRLNFRASCQKFRELDFEFGRKRFATINCSWGWLEQKICGIGKNSYYAIKGGRCDPIEETPHNSRLFRKAKTNTLTIQYDKPNCSRADFQLISTILKTVTYNKLHADFFSTKDCSDVIDCFASLIKDRNLEHAEVYLSLGSCRGFYDLDRTRAMLMQLPKMDKFTLNRLDRSSTVDKVLQNEWVIDDETLLHIVSQANHAELMNGDCTSEGIRKAVEVVRKSPLDSKSFSLYVPKSEVDNLDSSTRNFLRIVECQSYCKLETREQ